MQIIFAGKAHPQDQAGKELIREVVSRSRQPAFKGRIVFLENYDMETARFMVQGADVWLNTPRRPREASGTSGMKAAANGALNVSTLDGWWQEAWREIGPETDYAIGWAIGRGENYEDLDEQDRVEAEALYNVLEEDVVPTFYERVGRGLPRRWIEHMKASIGHLCPFFNTHRMVRQYTEQFYLRAAEHYEELSGADAERARALAEWKQRVRSHWPEVRIEQVDGDSISSLEVGGTVRVRAELQLGALTPDDVQVELYLGRLSARSEIVEAAAEPMTLVEPAGEGSYVFEAGAVPCRMSGLHGYTVRVLPHHPDLVDSFLPGLITWARPDGRL